MKDLTFGEQVKIILSRKGMTIKELAEQIQEETGKAMSRQNLTQRLGRDNFQEQDMRMIAAILGCPFHLSIFPTEGEDEFDIDTEAVLSYGKKSDKKKKTEPEEVYQQEFVFDDAKTVFVAEEPVEEAVEEIPEEEAVLVEEAVEEIPEEEAVLVEEAVEEIAEEEANEAESVTEIQEEVIEAVPVQEVASEQDITIGEFYEMQEEAVEEIEEIEEPESDKQDRFKTGNIFLRGFGRNKNKKNKKNEKREEPVEAEKPVEKVESVIEKAPRPIITPDSEDFEPVLRHIDAEEDLSIGELNPYTGREYQSNSVRMHPTRIGYVQVYDRNKHGWEDMTEWAFLGYQEQKKAMLGRDYEPPIYLD